MMNANLFFMAHLSRETRAQLDNAGAMPNSTHGGEDKSIIFNDLEMAI